MRYFKTTTPEISIHVSGGQPPINWDVADYGGGDGYYSTESEAEVAALEQCIKRNIGGGVSEIKEADFVTFQKKNANPTPLRGRRVDSPGFFPMGPAQDTMSAPVSRPAPAVAVPADKLATESLPPEEPPKPRIGKRKT